MPKGKEKKTGTDKVTLVFDAFLRLPDGAEVQVFWQEVTLDDEALALAKDLAEGMGYLGRAESWTDCRVMTESDGKPNCGPAELDYSGEFCRLLVPRSAESYKTERERLMRLEEGRIRASQKRPMSERALRTRVVKSFRATKSGVDTLPMRLLDAIAVDTADLQNRKWAQPPAAYEAVYARDPSTNPGVVSPSVGRMRKALRMPKPTIARYLLAGRPRPRIEDAVKIGEVMRAAAMSQFGWEVDEETGKRLPRAPWQVSGRGGGNKPIQDPTHPHALWLPEDADDDGWIDHITVFIADGMGEEIRSRLDRITRIWLTPAGARRNPGDDARIDEWRLALEGFGRPEDFVGASRLLAASRRWHSAYAVSCCRSSEEGRVSGRSASDCWSAAGSIPKE